jgi:RNA polymerase sigma factor (sigma-70 family)
MSVNVYTDKGLTELIVSDLEQGIIAFNAQYKTDCLRFIASKLSLYGEGVIPADEYEDLYMECLAITMENIQNQKFKPVNTIKNYFLGICVNQIKYALRKKGVTPNWVRPDMDLVEFKLNERNLKNSKRGNKKLSDDLDEESAASPDVGIEESDNGYSENPEDLFNPPSDLNMIRIDECKRILTEWERTGNRCHKMIDLFHFQNQSLAEIAEELEYENESVVRTLISRCRQRLKRLVIENMINES